MSRTKKQTTTQEIPEWLETGSQRAVELATGIADRPYTPYEGERIAGLSEAEQRASELALTGEGAWRSDLDRARELTEQGAGSFLDADIQGYMSPYISGALDPAARELREEMAREQQTIKGQAGMVGAFGGGRQAIAEAESRRGGMEAVSDLYGRGYQQAFESAREQFNVDRDAFARGAEQFRATGAQAQQQLHSDIGTLLTTGGLSRQLEQAGLDFDYQQFIEARDWDITNLGPLLETLSTVPYSKTTTQTAKKSVFDAVLSVASVAASAFFGGSAQSQDTGISPVSDVGAGGGYNAPGYGPPGSFDPYGTPPYAPGLSPPPFYPGESAYQPAYGGVPA